MSNCVSAIKSSFGESKNPVIAVAPMMDWTDRHCRYFLRQIAQNIILYTEMVTTKAIIYGGAERHLIFADTEKPVILQLGGHDPGELALCAKIGAEYGYQGINLNVGCPSPRVSEGRFGACLMREPKLVAEGVARMREAVPDVPITVKTRIGVDEQDSYDELCNFIEMVSQEGGCQHFIIHARKAWLSGLSPKENREIPPLRYEVVYQLKKDYPHLDIMLNGGVQTLPQAIEHLTQVNGVMIGRAAYHNPYFLSEIQHHFYGDSVKSRHEIIESMYEYLEEHLAGGGRLWQCVRHFLGLYQGQPGARLWRRYLSQNAIKPDASVSVLKEAQDLVR